MKLWNRKTVIGLALGALIMAIAINPFIVQAAPGCEYGTPGLTQQHFDPDKIAEKLSTIFGVDKDEILEYHTRGVKFIDLGRASLLAKASGQPLQKVMAAKTFDNNWKDVATALGVSREQIKATRQDIASTMLEEKLSISKQQALRLMQQGYRGRDIAVANELAQTTGKSIEDVLAMRQINNTWYDVALTLGVDDNTFRQDLQKLRTAFPHFNRLMVHQTMQHI
jgi:hypothetical protein